MKTDISDLFLTFSYMDEEIILDRKAEKTIFKRPVNDQSILTFKDILSICDWEASSSEIHPDIAYNEFSKISLRDMIQLFLKSR